MIFDSYRYMALIAIVLVFMPNSFAQTFSTYPTTLSVDRLTTDEGMPSNEVRGIYKDHTGFMWFLTDRGLVKYNGHDCQIFNHQTRNPNSFSSEELFAIWEDQQDVFWIGTKNGLNRLDTKTHRFTHFLHDPNNPTTLSDSFISDLLMDKKGNFWAGTSMGGLNRFDLTTHRSVSYRHDPNNPKSLSSDRTYHLFEDPSGKIWVSNTEGRPLDRLDPQTGQIDHFGITYPNEGHPSVTALFIEPSGVVWYGSWGYGLYRYDPQTDQYQNFRNDPSDPSSISSNIVQCIVQDQNGILWIGTRNGGLCTFNPSTHKFQRVKLVWKTDPNATVDTVLDLYWDPQNILWLATLSDGVCRFDSNREQIRYFKNNPKDPNSLNENRIFALCTDFDGSLWIGTDGGGLNHYNPTTNQFTHYVHNPDNPNSLDTNTVISLLLDRNGNLWLGSWGSKKTAFSRFNREKKEFHHYPNDPTQPDFDIGNVIRTITEDHTGTLWIGSESFAVLSFDPITETFHIYKMGTHGLAPSSTIRKIYEDQSRTLWIATEQGLQYFDREKVRFHSFQADPHKGVILPTCIILTLFDDSRNNLWIGTDQGLYQLEPDRKTLHQFTMEDGLADNVAKSIQEDSSGFLWISMDNGKITRFDPLTHSAISFDKSDGLQNLPFTSNCFAKGKQGELYFGGLNGLNCIWPDQITPNSFVPPIVLTSFEVMGKPFPIGQYLWDQKPIVLDHTQNFIAFEFAALNYTRSHKNQYAYRLSPLEDRFNPAGTLRYARYTSLQPGDYHLQVIGSNNDSVWNQEGISIPIHIKSPYWKTLWFKSCVGGLIALWIVLRYRNLQRQKKRLEMEVEWRTKELHETNRVLERLSMMDGLTQVPNRRCFDQHIRDEWSRALRNSTYLSLLFFDVDFFKKYNDYYGHTVGDECLKQVAQILNQNVKRTGDMVARYGGEEFVMLLTNVPPGNALKFAERICKQVEDLAIPHEASDIADVVTISIGVASIIPSQETSADSLVQAADRGVYQSKSHGRNRVSYYDLAHRITG